MGILLHSFEIRGTNPFSPKMVCT